VESAGSPRDSNYRHGFRVGTGPVHVPGRTGSTGNRPNRPNRSGSHRFREPWSRHIAQLVVDHAYLAAQLFVGRSHWLSPCARSLCLVARLLRAPPLDLLVGHTNSHRVPGHSVSRLDYSVRGHHDFVLWPQWLYFEYAMRYRDIVFRSHRVDHSSRLVFQATRERLPRPNN
jgi:hypothetical protein